MPYISNKLKKILELDVHFLEVPRANCGDLMGNGTKITLSKPSYFFRSVATCKRWRHTSAHHHFRKYFLTTELKIEINSIHYDTLSLILTFFSYFPPSITSPPPEHCITLSIIPKLYSWPFAQPPFLSPDCSID